MQNEVYVLRTWEFEKEIARLNKKARRIGAPEITFTNLGKVTRTKTVLVTGGDGEGEVSESRMPVDVTRYLIEMPEIAGDWKALARITPIEGDKPFVEALDAQFNITPWQSADVNHCDHCNVNRRRVISYVAKNVRDGRVMQLGRKCFEDVVGKDTLAAMEFQAVVVVDLGGDDEGFYPREFGHNAIPVVETATCVAMAEALYRVDGWQNNVRNKYSGDMVVEGTHRVVAASLNPMMRFVGENPHSVEGLKEMRAAKDSNEARESASQVIERMASFPTGEGEEDEFANALKVLADYKTIPARKAGLAAYMGQFLRNADQRARRAAKQATMTHVGTVGKRQDFLNLTCVKSPSFETDFGTCYINIFEDEDGNELVWKTGHGFGEGEKVSLKATVKAHGERNGVKQTIITRAKEIVSK